MHHPAPYLVRETRARACETKFVVDAALRPDLLGWARERLEPDRHGTGEHGDAYATSTLYFETPEFDVYGRRGSYGRSKYRVRRYGDSDVVFLERKFRTSRLLAKRRTVVPRDELQRVADMPAEPDWDGYWFARRVALRRLQPIAQLSYDRVARVGMSLAGPVRMTVDTNMRVLPQRGLGFLSDCGQRFLERACVVEVKYRESLPGLFRELAETFGLRVQKISKFRTGLRALDYPLRREPDEQVPHELSPETVDSAGAYAD